MKNDEVKRFQEKIESKIVSLELTLPCVYNISTSLANYCNRESLDPRIRAGLSEIIDTITEQAIAQCPEYGEYLTLLLAKTVEKKAKSN